MRRSQFYLLGILIAMFSVVTTDLFSQGCTLGSVTFTVEPAPKPTIAGLNLICPDSSTTLTVSQTFTNYLWSTDETDPSIIVDKPGTYTVTVTNSAGCTGTGTKTVSVMPTPKPVIAAAPYACNGQIALSTDSGFAAYKWSTSSMTQAAVATSSGSYTVTVTNSAGCTGSAAISVVVPPLPVVNITGANEICPNDSSVLAATPGFASYSWNTGDSSQSITITVADTYTVTATDSIGCRDTAMFTMTIFPAPAPVIFGPPTLCEGQPGALTVTQSFPAYLWNTSATTQLINVTNTGTYSVMVTDTNGCTGTTSFLLSVNPNPVPVISAAPYACNGQITLDAGAGFATYAWSTSETLPAISVASAGTYTVVVTDTLGCTGTDERTVSIPAPLVVAISGNPVFCENKSTALSATPGFVSYLWNTSETAPAVVVNAAGTYTVTVTDSLGCTGSAVQAVSVVSQLDPAVTALPYACNGQITLDAGAGFATYQWSTSEVSPTISVTTAGTYTVVVTDASGCSGTGELAVTIPASPVVAVSGNPVFCESSSTTLNATPGFVSYLWNTNESTPGITVSASGNYSVTATDAFGCTATATAGATALPLPTPQISGPTVICPGSSGTLGVTGIFSAYSWSTGETTPTISVTAASTYSVTVTATSGCTGSDTLIVTVPVPPVVAISGNSVFCANSSTTLNATSGFVSYLWNTNETTPGITINASGDYSVTATDALGCTAAAVFAAKAQPVPVPQISGPTVICVNNSGTLSVSGNYAAYAWSTAETTASIVVNTAGNFAVTVTDSLGCTGTAAQSVSVVAELAPAVTALPYACNGQITLDAGAGFATYKWNTSETSPTITVTSAGTYTVVVSDASGCTGTGELTVTIPAPPVVAVSGNSVFCENGNTALSATAGFAAYLWNTNETTSGITVTVSGNYVVTVTDALGCTGSAARTVNTVPQPEPQVSTHPYACNGQITLDAGAGFTTYKWSTGETTPAISVATAGTYTVVVSDASGCTGTDEQVVTIPVPPVVVVSGSPFFCENSSTILSATPGFASYLWNTNETTAGITVTASGIYSVTATDLSGCTATASSTATAQPLPAPAVSGTAFLCPGQSGALTASGNFVAYQWSTLQNTQTINVGSAGTYVVTVTDFLGCTGSAAASVAAATADTVFVQLTTCDPASVGTNTQVFPVSGGCDSVVITQTSLSGVVLTGSSTVLSNFNGYAVACAGDTNGQAIVTPGSGSAPFSYLWSNGATAQVAQNLGAGTYGVTFTDANGCSGTASVTLGEPTPVEPVIDATDPTCQNLGLIEVSQVTGGIGPYTVRLVQDIGTTNGTQPVNFNALDAGVFELEVTDANGCKAKETVVLLPAKPVEEFVSDTFKIFKGDTVVLNAAAGITIQPLFITWTPATDLSCIDCLNPSIAPARTTLVALDVAGFGGCKATGRFLIIVEAGRQYYAPNVIKPESTDNYGFTIYGDKDLVNIRHLQVYDRWGNHIAVFNNIAPNDPARGWDGTSRGQHMNAGVFAWWAELEYSDGNTQIVKGDVTLVR